MALNISRGGLFLKTNHYIRPGSSVALEFSLRAHEKIRAEARVVWATEGVAGNNQIFTQGLGLKFTDLPQPALGQIDQLTRAYLALP